MRQFVNKEELEQLIFEEIDGTSSEQGFAKLNEYIQNDPAALDHYLELILLCSGLSRKGEMLLPDISRQDISDQTLSGVWRALAEDERSAEAVEIEVPKVVDVPEKPKTPTRRSKLSLFSALAVAACFILVVTILALNRPQIYEPVATISDGSSALWQSSRDCSVGSRVYTGTVMKLVDGFAEIQFDNTARVIIQSPSTIIIEDRNQMFLESGKISAVVPPPAKGFLVRTNGASVVDYGTEFGVVTDKQGNTEAHVFVGEVELRSGQDPIRFGSSMRLEGGQASKVYDGVLSEKVKAEPMAFIRDIPQEQKFGIPGKRLDLADILSGGNGLGTGENTVAIDPATGKMSSEVLIDYRNVEAAGFAVVPGNLCIDGVFVPIGGKQKIASSGLSINGIPQTDGRYWTDISNWPITGMPGDNNETAELARLNDIEYGSGLHPAILMHANTGITFDLDIIRSMNPGVCISSFTSICGLSETLTDAGIQGGYKAVLWVFVDGVECEKVELVYDTENINFKDIHIKLDNSSHYLTLMSTDGLDGNNCDWTVFGDPALELEQIKSLD